LVSTIAHSTAIGIAVVATAHARIDESTPHEVVRWIEPVAKPIASRAADAPLKPSPPSTSAPAVPAITLDRIDVDLPPIDLTQRAPSPDVIPVGGGDATPGVNADSAKGIESTAPFSAEQVERQVTLRNGGRAPRYPSSLRASGIDGEVVALFVVSEAGRVEPASVRFVNSDHVLFEAAVREALDGMRFNAAEVGGKRVRQLVQMPFVFTLTR
jgi:protein TonB